MKDKSLTELIFPKNSFGTVMALPISKKEQVRCQDLRSFFFFFFHYLLRVQQCCMFVQKVNDSSFLLALANLHPGVTSHPEIRQAKRDFLRALAVLKRARF